jgi:hypothetical protein
LFKYIISNCNLTTEDYNQTLYLVEIVIDNKGDVVLSRIKEKNYNNLSVNELEILRVINKMPKWKPGSCRGINVPVLLILPIHIEFAN